MKKIRHLLEYGGLLILVQLASLLTLPVILAIGAGLGRFTYSVLRIRRKVSIENLCQAFPEKSQAEIERIALQQYRNFGMMLMEYLRLPKMSAGKLNELVRFRDESCSAQWQKALQQGRGAICMTGHFGNWEYMGAMVAQRFPMMFLYQAQNNPYVDGLIRRTRERVGMASLPRGSAVRGILKALREKKFVAILADQDAGDSGLFVDFMDRPSSTAQGPAAFILRSGAPLLFVVAIRQPGGKHLVESQTLKFEFPESMNEQEKLHHITQAWSRVLESYIRRHPDHWFWMHRRWKTKPPLTPIKNPASALEPADGAKN